MEERKRCAWIGRDRKRGSKGKKRETEKGGTGKRLKGIEEEEG